MAADALPEGLGPLPSPIVFVHLPTPNEPAPPGAYTTLDQALEAIGCSGTVILKPGVHTVANYALLRPPKGGSLAIVGSQDARGMMTQLVRANANSTEVVRIIALSAEVLVSRLAINGTVYVEGMTSGGGHTVCIESCVIDGGGAAGVVDGYARDRPGRLLVRNCRLQNCSTGLFSMRVDGAVRLEGTQVLDCRAGIVFGNVACAEVDRCRFERIAAAGVMTAGASRGVRVTGCAFVDCAEAIEDRSGRLRASRNEARPPSRPPGGEMAIRALRGRDS
eukprot:tig00000796_g4231.t1